MENGIELTFQLGSKDKASSANFSCHRLIIAGWTGRNLEKMEEHIVELEALGITRPSRTPVFYRVAIDRLTQRRNLQSPGNNSSGEVEFVLFKQGSALWVGVGSDHTDREVETYNITISKQMCEKPIANTLWPLAEVIPHWDQLLLKSWAIIDGKRHLYQEGPVASMLAPESLLAEFSQAGDEEFLDGDVMFCGTMPAIGGIKPATRFEFELYDPVLDRKISHGYDIEILPIND